MLNLKITGDHKCQLSKHSLCFPALIVFPPLSSYSTWGDGRTQCAFPLVPLIASNSSHGIGDSRVCSCGLFRSAEDPSCCKMHRGFPGKNVKIDGIVETFWSAVIVRFDNNVGNVFAGANARVAACPCNRPLCPSECASVASAPTVAAGQPALPFRFALSIVSFDVSLY